MQLLSVMPVARRGHDQASATIVPMTIRHHLQVSFSNFRPSTYNCITRTCFKSVSVNMISSLGPLKRPKSNSDASRTPSKHHRTADLEVLFFHDGDVVLSAKREHNRDGLAYFRVHKSILKENPSIFETLFSLPSPASVDTFDGVPLVHLHDTEGDLKLFLRVLYNIECVCFPPC